jgi:hypothetical protein
MPLVAISRILAPFEELTWKFITQKFLLRVMRQFGSPIS